MILSLLYGLGNEFILTINLGDSELEKTTVGIALFSLFAIKTPSLNICLSLSDEEVTSTESYFLSRNI